MKAAIILAGWGLASSIAMGCGLEWTLPSNHFDGVEKHGYVEYWEKIGQVDLGDGLVIPVNISFNSHQEASSPYLGKGWIVALLESHVEPVDENAMHVIMPDGWTFTFLRNGSSETWRGNSGWIGETNSTHFTITAPCGWKIKFDVGKIQEIDSNKNQIFSYKYNGSVATEVDVDGKPIVQVEYDTNVGMPSGLVVGGEKIDISLGQRPQVMSELNQNLITGFDQSLNRLEWWDGAKESFVFTTDKAIIPTLVITHADQTQRIFSWDPTTKQVMTDGEWTYYRNPANNNDLNRINAKGQSEYFYTDSLTGRTIEQGLDGVKRITTRFVNAGPLSGKPREVIQIKDGKQIIHKYDYDENGTLTRILDSTGSVISYAQSALNGNSQVIFTPPTGKSITYNYDSKTGFLTIINN